VGFLDKSLFHVRTKIGSVQMVYVPECKFLLCCVGVLNYFHSQVQHSWIT